MMICPGCNKPQIDGSLYCGECGTCLVTTDRLSTQVIRRASTDHLIPPRGGTAPLDAPTIENTAERNIFLHLIDSAQTLHIFGRNEYSLGRIVEDQPVAPDLDLGPYDGYGQGVSRMHAILRWNGSRIMIIDLGSSNGTRVNGQKITPKVEFSLMHGDMIALGKLRIQIFLRK